ncbi:MAG: cytochrome c oxidase accessory protein CcoG [Rickettsiaceae bacterium]|jgi:cytochrome c oxidase accessory protein FixG|nr:cytochrome c oxidase accessory protein CcoG [Rickettsiaceae bacterium]
MSSSSGLLSYFEKRQKTYPQNVRGRFRRIKNFTNFICLAIFFAVPFLRYQRGALSSDQAILIDIPNSRGYFFGIEMWPEEVYYLAAILIFAAVALFFVTSLFGRVWCGYSCPQTVWTDLFIKTERLFQGDRNDRIKLDRKTFSFQNIWRKTATHFCWILISLITGIGFVNYFNDAPTVLKDLWNLNISWSVGGWILGVAASTYIMAGFAREQVCNYMCPYARFQSAMFDPDTLIISYDEKRGETRGKHKKGDSFENRGHCIDCKQCVVVCPQNIDIRNGLQMECIACGLCVDACDNVMEQMSLPKGLIRYDTSRNLESKEFRPENKFKIWRPRTFYYSAILLVVGGILVFNLLNKSSLKVDILPDRNPIFVMLSNGDIRDGYTIKISNKTFEEKSYNLKIEGIKDPMVKSEEFDVNDMKVKAGAVEAFKIYISAREENLSTKNGRDKINFIITDNKTGESFSVKSVFTSK